MPIKRKSLASAVDKVCGRQKWTALCAQRAPARCVSV